MELVKVNPYGQVTIPNELRKKIHCRPGDYMEVDFKEKEKTILLRPAIVINPSQSYFWTKEWQEKEKEADGDIKAGSVKKFKSAKALIKELHE